MISRLTFCTLVVHVHSIQYCSGIISVRHILNQWLLVLLQMQKWYNKFKYFWTCFNILGVYEGEVFHVTVKSCGNKSAFELQLAKMASYFSCFTNSSYEEKGWDTDFGKSFIRKTWQNKRWVVPLYVHKKAHKFIHICTKALGTHCKFKSSPMLNCACDILKKFGRQPDLNLVLSDYKTLYLTVCSTLSILYGREQDKLS